MAHRAGRWGALAWLGLAWLAGPVPGFGDRGVTGQPMGELWWWHLGALVLVLWVVVAAVRAGDLTARWERASARAWRRGGRWRTVVVSGWLALAALAAAHALNGRASWGDVVTFVAAAAIVALAPRRGVGGEAVPRLAVGAAVLAVFAVVTFVAAAQGAMVDDPFAYYGIKQQVRAPVAAHNVLAGFLLAGAPAVALASIRRPRWWWPGLVLVGLGLAATLSRGAAVAGLVAVVTAWLALRDRTLARRVGVVVLLGALGTAIALAMLGAANPDTDGPTSVVARAELWEAAGEAAAEHPVAGVGLDGFLPFTQDDAVLDAPHEHAHDLPLHAAATLGVPGLVAVLVVWGGIAVGAAGLLDRDRRIVVLVALAGLGALALVDEVALRPGTTGLLALLAVTVAAPRDPGPAIPGPGPEPASEQR